jgi:hypothetical protein
MSLGYDLFLDKDRFKARFIAADILDPDSELVKQLSNEISLMYTGNFFHLFSWADQIIAAKRLVGLLQPRPGSLIFGRHVGHVVPGFRPQRAGGTKYQHNIASWAKLWEQVGLETGSKWSVDATLTSMDDAAEAGFTEGTSILKFIVRRK